MVHCVKFSAQTKCLNFEKHSMTDPSIPIQTHPNPSKPIQTHPNPPILTKTHQNPLIPTKAHQNPPKPIHWQWLSGKTFLHMLYRVHGKHWATVVTFEAVSIHHNSQSSDRPDSWPPGRENRWPAVQSRPSWPPFATLISKEGIKLQ